MTQHIVYQILSETPSPQGHVYRVVEIFDTLEDAEKVLKILEEVNVSFHVYKIDKKEVE